MKDLNSIYPSSCARVTPRHCLTSKILREHLLLLLHLFSDIPFYPMIFPVHIHHITIWGFPKTGYPEIIHFSGISPYKPSSYGGTPIYGHPHIHWYLTHISSSLEKFYLPPSSPTASAGDWVYFWPGDTACRGFWSSSGFVHNWQEKKGLAPKIPSSFCGNLPLAGF